MAVRKFKPVTPGQRHKIAISFDTITTSKPEKSLLVPNHRSGGRNDTGKMTIANVGGGSTYPNANFEERGGEDPHLNHCNVALKRRAWKLPRRVGREHG